MEEEIKSHVWEDLKGRINELQQIINRCNMNLLDRDMETGEYNYVIKFRALKSLTSELFHYLIEKEREECEKFIERCEFSMNEKYIFQKQENHGYGGKETKVFLINTGWKILEKLLFEFEKEIRELMGKYFSPDKLEKQNKKQV